MKVENGMWKSNFFYYYRKNILVKNCLWVSSLGKLLLNWYLHDQMFPFHRLINLEKIMTIQQRNLAASLQHDKKNSIHCQRARVMTSLQMCYVRRCSVIPVPARPGTWCLDLAMRKYQVNLKEQLFSYREWKVMCSLKNN